MDVGSHIRATFLLDARPVERRPAPQFCERAPLRSPGPSCYIGLIIRSPVVESTPPGFNDRRGRLDGLSESPFDQEGRLDGAEQQESIAGRRWRGSLRPRPQEFSEGPDRPGACPGSGSSSAWTNGADPAAANARGIERASRNSRQGQYEQNSTGQQRRWRRPGPSASI